MKDKLKKFMTEHENVAATCIIFIVVAVGMLPFSLIGRNAKKNDPMESTSEEGIKATSFDFSNMLHDLKQPALIFAAKNLFY